MPSNITIQLEIQPHLKKYLIAQSNNKTEPVQFPKKSEFNLLLVKLVTIYTGEPGKNVYRRLTQPSIIEIVLPYNQIKDVRCYNYIGENRRRKFRKEVNEDFKFNLKLYLKHEMNKGTNRKNAILQFMDNNNITEDEIKFSSLYRYSSRLIKKWYKMNKKAGLISQLNGAECQSF